MDLVGSSGLDMYRKIESHPGGVSSSSSRRWCTLAIQRWCRSTSASSRSEASLVPGWSFRRSATLTISIPPDLSRGTMHSALLLAGPFTRTLACTRIQP